MNKKTIFPKVDYKQALVKNYGEEGIDYYVVLMSLLTFVRNIGVSGIFSCV